ncbi:MAG: hypothetical protein BGO98_17810 [Myxococcales bacterium 68-20]|nr:hypothetical protein [Myxococcales bacterium]OJY23799.1 MAG: hypothetical protein BGO98_17810 [Myxococcales bacterium 68-20]
MRPAHNLGLALFIIAAAACSSSSDDDNDKDRQTEADGKDDASHARGPSGGSTSGAEPPPEDTVDAGAGVTWTALYRDLFGPMAPSGCAGSGTCHGAAGESGAQASNGYVCATKEGCRESMLSLETGLVQSRDFSAPSKSTLVDVLRRRDANGAVVGSMPKRSSYVFSRDSIDRIETWIANGAPDD